MEFPNIEAIAAGTISGAFRDWPKVRPEALALLQRVEELERGVQYWKEQATDVAACHLAAVERAEAAEAKLAEAIAAIVAPGGWEERCKKAEAKLAEAQATIRTVEVNFLTKIAEQAQEVKRLEGLILAWADTQADSDIRPFIAISAEARRIREGKRA